MQAHEQLGIETFLERRHGMMDEPAAAPDVEPHIVALGADPVDGVGPGSVGELLEEAGDDALVLGAEVAACAVGEAVHDRPPHEALRALSRAGAEASAASGPEPRMVLCRAEMRL